MTKSALQFLGILVEHNLMFLLNEFKIIKREVRTKKYPLAFITADILNIMNYHDDLNSFTPLINAICVTCTPYLLSVSSRSWRLFLCYDSW